jgi:hypothetical protein
MGGLSRESGIFFCIAVRDNNAGARNQAIENIGDTPYFVDETGARLHIMDDAPSPRQTSDVRKTRYIPILG